MSIKNQGMRLHEWGGRLRWEAWTAPDPGPGEVAVEVEACGVGGTVVNYTAGTTWNDPSLLPLVPGHEVVARVVAVGDEVEAPRVGDRVLAYFYLSCFACSECAGGRETRCRRLAGRYGVHRPGGYARFSVLPAGNAVPLGSDLDAAAATVVPDAVATPLHVCETRLALAPGERVVVIGAGGGVGIHLVQVAIRCGARVVGLDVGDRKLSLVKRFGATPLDSTRFEEARLAEWGGLADVVVDLVGSRQSLRWAHEHLDQGGRLCVLTANGDPELPLSPRDLVSQERVVLGSHYASRREMSRAAELVASGEVTPVVGRVVEPREVDELHGLLRAGRLEGRGAIVWSRSG